MRKSDLRFPGSNEDYVERKINDLCKVIDCQHSTAPVVTEETNYKMIRTGNVRNASLIIKTMDSVVEDTYHKWSVRGYLEVDDVILTREAPMGEVAIIKSDEYRFFLGQRVLQLKSNTENVIPGYLHLLFQSNRFETYIRPLRSSGSTVSNIRIPELKQMKFYIPCLVEQQKITSFFTFLDQKIEKQQEKIEKLEELKKGMMQKIFSREIRFKDEDGQEFPEWGKNKINQICSINPKSGELEDVFYYIDLESVEKGILKNLNIVSKSTAPSRAQRVLEKNDILFQTVRPYQQNNLVFSKLYDKQAVASTGYAQIRTNQNNEFIYQLINTKKFNRDVMIRCTGTSYPAISSSDLGEIIVSIPTIKEQNKIAELLSKIDFKIDNENNKLTELVIQKKGFMQRMFV